MRITYTSAETGDEFTTAARTVTEADITNFAGVSGDFNRLHTDAESMADSDFGERIAHGALVFSIATGLLWQARENHEDVVAFYGVDDLRFTAPVFVGDTVHVELEVIEKEPREHPEANGVVTTAARVLNQNDDVVLHCELLSLLR